MTGASILLGCSGLSSRVPMNLLFFWGQETGSKSGPGSGQALAALGFGYAANMPIKLLHSCAAGEFQDPEILNTSRASLYVARAVSS